MNPAEVSRIHRSYSFQNDTFRNQILKKRNLIAVEKEEGGGGATYCLTASSLFIFFQLFLLKMSHLICSDLVFIAVMSVVYHNTAVHVLAAPRHSSLSLSFPIFCSLSLQIKIKKKKAFWFPKNNKTIFFFLTCKEIFFVHLVFHCFQRLVLFFQFLIPLK